MVLFAQGWGAGLHVDPAYLLILLATTAIIFIVPPWVFIQATRHLTLNRRLPVVIVGSIGLGLVLCALIFLIQIPFFRKGGSFENLIWGLAASAALGVPLLCLALWLRLRSSPAEKAYLEALRLQGSAPDQAAAKLEALIAVYGSGAGAAENAACVVMARKKLTAIQQRKPDDAGQLELRLDDAERLAQAAPDQARAICHSIIQLYADKTWAAPAVARARKISTAIAT